MNKPEVIESGVPMSGLLRQGIAFVRDFAAFAGLSGVIASTLAVTSKASVSSYWCLCCRSSPQPIPRPDGRTASSRGRSTHCRRADPLVTPVAVARPVREITGQGAAAKRLARRARTLSLKPISIRASMILRRATIMARMTTTMATRARRVSPTRTRSRRSRCARHAICAGDCAGPDRVSRRQFPL